MLYRTATSSDQFRRRCCLSKGGWISPFFFNIFNFNLSISRFLLTFRSQRIYTTWSLFSLTRSPFKISFSWSSARRHMIDETFCLLVVCLQNLRFKARSRSWHNWARLILRIFTILLSVFFGHDPGTEALRESQGNFRRPFEEGVPFDHVSELDRGDTQLVNLFFQLFKFLINYVHYVLLWLSSVRQSSIVLIFTKVFIMRVAHGVDVMRNTQNTVLL